MSEKSADDDNNDYDSEYDGSYYSEYDDSDDAADSEVSESETSQISGENDNFGGVASSARKEVAASKKRQILLE